MSNDLIERLRAYSSPGMTGIKRQIVDDFTEAANKIADLQTCQTNMVDLLLEAVDQIDVTNLADVDLECERRNLKLRINAELARVRPR